MKKIYPVYFTCKNHFEELSLSIKALKNISYPFEKVYIYCDVTDFFTDEQLKQLKEFEVRKTRSSISWGGIQTIENELLAFNDIRKEIDKDNYIMNIDSDSIIVSDSIFQKVSRLEAGLIGFPLELFFSESNQESLAFQQGSCYFIKSSAVLKLLKTYKDYRKEIIKEICDLTSLPLNSIPADITISKIAEKSKIKRKYLNFMATDDLSVIHLQLTKNDHWKPFGRLLGLNEFGQHHIQNLERKIKVFDWMPEWDGQWKEIINSFKQLHNESGIWFHSALEEFFRKDKIIEPWIGFFHNLFDYSNLEEEKYRGYSLNEILDSKNFKESIPYCRGIFVLSNHIKSILEQKVDVPIEVLVHPSRSPSKTFDFEKFKSVPKVYHIGHWLRNFFPYFDLEAKTKFMTHITLSEGQYIRSKISKEKRKTVKILERRLNRIEYERIFESSIIFLNLYDCGACNTVNECILANTPLLVNKINGVVDYLGDEYPFYYNTLEEAKSKLENDKLIKETNIYLSKLPIKEKMTTDCFINSFANSKVYKGL